MLLKNQVKKWGNALEKSHLLLINVEADPSAMHKPMIIRLDNLSFGYLSKV
jgi:hypothetical protein